MFVYVYYGKQKSDKNKKRQNKIFEVVEYFRSLVVVQILVVVKILLFYFFTSKTYYVSIKQNLSSQKRCDFTVVVNVDLVFTRISS